MKIKSLAKFFLQTLILPLTVLSTHSARADTSFPNRFIRIIVPAAAGGSLDLTARLVAQKMSEKLGQAVVVENRPGAETLVGTRAVQLAPADGYTILAQSNGFTMLPFIKIDPGFDLFKDFLPLGNMISLPFVMLTGSEQPERTVADYVALARTKRATYASGGVGNPPQLASAMFFQSAGIDPDTVTHVGYKGNGAALPDIAAGRVGMIFDGYISSKAFIDGNKMRPLAVTSTNRIAPLPDVPTFAELGFKYSYKLWLGLIIRAGTPKDVTQRRSDALKFALENKDLSERFRREGSDPSFTSSEEFTDYLKAEYVQNAKLAVDLKLEKQ